MKAITDRYGIVKNKYFVFSLITGIFLLLLALVINFYAGTYATKSASEPVTDIILSNIRVYDVDTFFVWGPVFLWVFVTSLCLYRPNRFPFALKSLAIFLVIRSIFVTLTHIGPFPDQLGLETSHVWFSKFTFGGDLFFSAHTGTPYLMALVFWNNKHLRSLFIAIALFFGVIVLLGHYHYSIDVLAAFFITYSIYKIAEKVFKKDKILFDRHETANF